MTDRLEHWRHVYETRPTDQVGWFEADPLISRQLVDRAVAAGARSVIDVGGGASALVDHLLDLDLDAVAVLDIAVPALAIVQARLGARAQRVRWIVGDVARLDGVGTYDVWHDRAVLHFLLDAEERAAYRRLVLHTVPAGGTVIIATFAPDGPERCSGLPIHRSGPEELAAELGDGFMLETSLRHEHDTPGGTIQRYQYSVLRRTATSD
jgi:trans-aconitate methyltransferase